MRAFHELVFDDRLQDSGVLHATILPWSPLLGAADILRVLVTVDGVGGISPTFNLIFADMELGAYPLANIAEVAISDAALSASTVTQLSARLDAGDASFPLSSSPVLIFWLNGTAPSAHVRIWVTGRTN